MIHIKAFTYEPKIQAVIDGKCRQTIRIMGKRPVVVGDAILFHGWEGRPYCSKWSWRKEVEVKEVTDICTTQSGVRYEIEGIKHDKPWETLDSLAKLDGIEPPTGIALGELLCSMHKVTEPTEFQIIRW